VRYWLSNKAEQDLREIYRYSRLKFGEMRTDAYFIGLNDKFNLLASNVSLAQKVDRIRQGYYRCFYQKHAVYFVAKRDGIFIVRVLHQKMKPELHL